MILTVTLAPMQMISLAALRAFTIAASAAGIDAVFFLRAPPPAPCYDPLVVIAALAELDLSIGLGGSIPIDVSEPFHVARSFAAIDRLTQGRSALILDNAAYLETACGHTAPPERRARRLEFFDVVGKLLDSWEDAALLVDRPAGLFTDPDRIHRIDHDGPHYAVRGPLNAPRPLQGAPIMVAPATIDPDLAARVADVVLIAGPNRAAVQRDAAALREHAAAAGRPREAVRILADITPAALLRDWSDVGDIDGFNVALPTASLGDLAQAAALAGRTTWQTGTLRQRLGLARHPSRYAA